MNKELLREEAIRQGRQYSRLVVEDYESFWGSSHWDFMRCEKARWMISRAQHLLGSEMGSWSVLEIGCGIGFTTLEVALLGLPYIESLLAIDTSTEALKVACRLLEKAGTEVRDRVRFQEENFFDHNEGPYHLIYMHEVFEHIPDFNAIFQQAYRLLHPGGLFMVSTPNSARLSNRLLGLLGKKPYLIDPFHIREYNLSELMGGSYPLIPVMNTGRGVLDELVVGGFCSLGNKSLFKRIRPFVGHVVRSKINYYAGALVPALSSELLLMYKRDFK